MVDSDIVDAQMTMQMADIVEQRMDDSCGVFVIDEFLLAQIGSR